MAWAALTAAMVQAHLSGEELDKLRTSALADGQPDPLPVIISQVTNQVQGYIAARGGVVMGSGATLPKEVITSAIAIVRWRLCGRLGIGGAAGILQTPQRQKDYEDAIEFLKGVAKGEIAVEQGGVAVAGTHGVWGSEEKVDFGV